MSGRACADADVEPQVEHSHFIPDAAVVFRGRVHRRQYALCGAVVDEGKHCPEPTCPACREMRQQEADDAAEIFTELGYVRNARGIWVPSEGRAL